MPDNKQIDDTLQYVRDTSPVDVDRLSLVGESWFMTHILLRRHG
jgi:hypothetical protein